MISVHHADERSLRRWLYADSKGTTGPTCRSGIGACMHTSKRRRGTELTEQGGEEGSNKPASLPMCIHSKRTRGTE